VIISNGQRDEVVISPANITLRFGEMTPVVIPRASCRNQLRLLEWVYRLTDWPGMNLQRLRTFITAVSKHHGWGLPEAADNVLHREAAHVADSVTQLRRAA
jgi:hypothetical protein